MKKYVTIRVQKLRDWGNGYEKMERRIRRKKGFSEFVTRKIRGVEASIAHVLRRIITLNSDPERRKRITICCKTFEWKPVQLTAKTAKEIGADSADYVVKLAKERISKLGIIDSKKESCKVVEMILTVSPEWLRDGDEENPINPEKEAAFVKCAFNFLRETYKDNCLFACEHPDELNTHVHAYILPAVLKVRKNAGRPRKRSIVVPKSKPVEIWGLDSKSMFTPDHRIQDPSKEDDSAVIRLAHSGTCSQLQRDFALYCQQHGLDVERGIVGSRAKYQEVSKYTRLLRHAAMQEDELEEIIDIDQLRTVALQNYLKAKDHDRIACELKLLQEQVLAEQRPLLKELNQSALKVKKLQHDSDQLTIQMAAKARAVPVGELIEKLTGVESRPGANSGKCLYVLHTGMQLEVDVATNKFKNLTPEISGQGNMSSKSAGRGGIDAAIFLTGCSPEAAQILIVDLFSIDTAVATISEALHSAPNTPERKMLSDHAISVASDVGKPDPSKWPTLRNYLVGTLGLTENIIDKLKQDGWIRANRYGHLVAERKIIDSNGKIRPSGNFVQDVTQPITGYYAENGIGYTTIFEAKGTEPIVIVDDPLEALALEAHLSKSNISRTVFAIGRKRKPKTEEFLRMLGKKTKIYFTEIPSEIGRKFAEWVRRILPTAKEIAPPHGRLSWREYLSGLSDRKPEHTRKLPVVNEPALEKERGKKADGAPKCPSIKEIAPEDTQS